MALKQTKQSRMLKVALKESTLEVIDKTTPEMNTNLYAPSKQKDDSLTSLLSDEDLYSEYDDEGNKISVYKKEEPPKVNHVAIILIVFLGILSVLAFVVYTVTVL